MKLLFDGLPLTGNPSGTRSRILGLMEELTRRGIRCAVLLQEDVADSVLEEFPVIRIDCGPSRVNRRSSWKTVARIFREESFHYLVCDALPWPSGIPIIGTIHDLRYLEPSQPLLIRWLFRRTLRRCMGAARCVHVVSETTRHELENALGSDDRLLNKTFVVPNGVRSAFSCEGMESKDHVLWVGHLESRKAPEFALAIQACQIRGSTDSPPLIMVGTGPMEGELRRAIGAAPELKVEMRRPVGEQELADLYRRASAFLATSHLEGFGMCLAEAMACGTPVVARDIAAHREVLCGQGLLMDSNDPADWAAALRGIETTPRSDVPTLPWTVERSADAFLHSLDQAATE